jgi:hypothetical protein
MLSGSVKRFSLGKAFHFTVLWAHCASGLGAPPRDPDDARRPVGAPRPRPRHVRRYRIPGNKPFIPRNIFCIPPFATSFITFCVCSNWLSS